MILNKFIPIGQRSIPWFRNSKHIYKLSWAVGDYVSGEKGRKLINTEEKINSSQITESQITESQITENQNLDPTKKRYTELNDRHTELNDRED